MPALTGAPVVGVEAWVRGDDTPPLRAPLAPAGMRPVSERPVEAVSPAVRRGPLPRCPRVCRFSF